MEQTELDKEYTHRILFAPPHGSPAPARRGSAGLIVVVKLHKWLDHRGYIKGGPSHSDVTHGFVDYHCEASSLAFSPQRLGFLEPRVTIFGRDGVFFFWNLHLATVGSDAL